MNGRTRPVLLRFHPDVLAALDLEVRAQSHSWQRAHRTDVLMRYVIDGLGVDHRGKPLTAAARRRAAAARER